MTEHEVYEKPKMERVELRSNKNIADRCWALANKDQVEPLYYDVPDSYGTWICFQISAGNCGGHELTTTVIEHGENMTDQEAADLATSLNIDAINLGSDFNDYGPFYPYKRNSW